jgi:transcriptional regulator with XRE-family HTH domain
MELGEEAGLHFTYVSAVECRKRNVSIDAMERLANALGMDLWVLLQQR